MYVFVCVHTHTHTHTLYIYVYIKIGDMCVCVSIGAAGATARAGRDACGHGAAAGPKFTSQCTCFIVTQVQVLTPEKLLGGHRGAGASEH
jgi:hypothetical protein